MTHWVIGVLLLSGCSSFVNVIPLDGYGSRRPASKTHLVKVFRNAENIGRGFVEIAVLQAKDEGKPSTHYVKAFREKAASMGAQAILLSKDTEEGAPKAFGTARAAHRKGYHSATALVFTEEP